MLNARISSYSKASQVLSKRASEHGTPSQRLQSKRRKDCELSCNKLTEKSGETFKRLLEHTECAIERLWLGTNRLGNSGTEHIFQGLEKNRSLRILSLKDNKISDSGTRSMAESLRNNETLEELHLCMNLFGNVGIRNLKKLRRYRPNLKIVIRIADDEEVLIYAEEKVKRLLSNGWKQYNTELLVQIFDRVMEDLNNGYELSHEQDAKKTDRIKTLIADISKLRKQIKKMGQKSRT
ncbi:hypothetical protein NDU88_003129 [Pleurodeles waltl]|uniref:Uncharacterized protein n=1 Tax=Pleurodeles waltl TaxID=8319 RepID=A0AAV7SEH1_PLEWA|nr:hypothetical protein NDU88_003129 [Pleurodeles waltl]